MVRLRNLIPKPAKRLLRGVGRAVVPRRLRLPLRFWWRQRAGILDPELMFVRKRTWKRGIAIDIGANQGIYSYALASIFERVEAFEPNRSVAAPLYQLASRKITVHDEALSDRPGEAKLHTPVSSSGVEYPGWGSLDRDALPPADEVRTCVVATRTLDSYGFDNVVLIKIDVEGHELAVLQGASRTLARWRPTILVEVKDAARESIWHFFIEKKYSCSVLQNNLRPIRTLSAFYSSEKENFFWLPTG